MTLVLLFIGIIIVVAAFRNSQGALFTALYEDVPGYVTWAAAIFAIGAVGFIPGLRPVSRGILALVIVVIVLRNYQNIIKGFQDVWQNPPTATPAGSGSNASGSSGSLLPSGADLGSIFSNPQILSMASSSFGSGGGSAVT